MAASTGSEYSETGVVRYQSDHPGGDYYYLVSEADRSTIELRPASTEIFHELSAELNQRVTVWLRANPDSGLIEVVAVGSRSP